MHFHHRTPRITAIGRAVLVLITAATCFFAQPTPKVTAQDGKPPVYSLMLPVLTRGQQPYFRKADPTPLPEWLATVNEFRSMSNLPPVSEDPEFSEGDLLHSRYSVKNDVLMHDEIEGNPYYTEAGKRAAQASNLMADWDHTKSDREAIEAWMQAPFHALAILDPELSRVGYGAYREADGNIQMSAALDVLRGRAGVPAGVQFPIFWPGDGATVSLLQFWGESPDPLTSCPGYSTPAGLPIYIQTGAGDQTPNVTDYKVKVDGRAVESCAISETSYRNPDANTQALGRAILNDRDAVVIIPRQPLEPGKTYQVSVTIDGQQYAWSFNTAR